MPLSRVRITTLRCLREVELELDPSRNYIFGPNGAGKTSLREGLFVLGRGRSFRTRQMRRLVRHGADGFAVFGVADVDGAERRLGVAYRAGRLEKKIDGQPAVGMAQLDALLPVHAIDPSTHAIVEGGPSERRRFLDWGVFHVEPTYLDAWKGYRRVLSQRNAALKRGARVRNVRVAVGSEPEHPTWMPETQPREVQFIELAPLLSRSPRKARVDLVGTVSVAEDSRLVARARSRVTGLVGLDERDARSCA